MQEGFFIEGKTVKHSSTLLVGRLPRVAAALAAASIVASVGATSSAQGGATSPEPLRLAQASPGDEPIFGSQIMTTEEQDDYRARWRAAATDQERDRVRSEHHERMKDRARERGVTLPDEPPPRGGGMGPGPGAGPGRR